MPLLDHFHPPLHGPRRWESFHNNWATYISVQLNRTLPSDYFAETEVTLGREMEIDVAALEASSGDRGDREERRFGRRRGRKSLPR